MSLQASLQTALQSAVPARAGVHVLAYHLVGGGTASPVDVGRADFRAQMAELAESGAVLSLDEAVRRLTAGDPWQRTNVVLTFDDAYQNFLTEAWPLLRDLGLPATLYVPTGFVESGAPLPMEAARGLPPANWDELAAAREEGLELGSHSHLHAELPSLGDDAIAADLERARALLVARTGASADHFCYPRALWSRRAEAVVARFHRSAAIAGGVVNRPAGFRPLRLSRVPVRRDLGDSLAPVLESGLWLREWAASRARDVRSQLHRRRGGARAEE